MNEIINKTVKFRDLGRMDYQEAWDFQEAIFAETVALKIKNRSSLLQNRPQHPITCFSSNILMYIPWAKAGSLKTSCWTNQDLKSMRPAITKSIEVETSPITAQDNWSAILFSIWTISSPTFTNTCDCLRKRSY